jgi:hypothetical protein
MWNYADGRWREHMRVPGDAAQIAGYLGNSDAFDKAMVKFAFAYAELTQKDHELFVKAVRSGRIKSNAKAG